MPQAQHLMEHDVTTLDDHPTARASAGEDIPSALAHLASIGITTDVLAAAGVDATCPDALRAEAETLLASVLAENQIADDRHANELSHALAALYPAAERAANDELARDIRERLRASRVIIPPPEPRYGDTCLNTE